jgi:hypothetical protein
MKWDGNKTNDYFIGLYKKQNPKQYLNKPKHDMFDNLHDIELALQDLYSECAQNAWTEERLLATLDKIINSWTTNIEAKNSEKYLKTIMDIANNLKKSILDKSFSI